MKTSNYIVLIHFAAALTRHNLAAVAPLINAKVRAVLTSCEAILCSDHAVAFCGESEKGATEVFTLIGPGLRPGDQLSVIPVLAPVATSHPGLHRAFHSSAPHE